MKVNVEELVNGKVIESDVCVVGGGPSGMTIAKDFIGSGLQVAVLESGGSEGNMHAQQLSAGALSGELYEAQELTHIRQVGGTANMMILKMADKQFGYRYSTFEAIDFEKRDGIPNSGWPISKVDLDPYYEKAQTMCEIGTYEYAPEYWLKEEDLLLPLAKEKAYNSVFMFGPTRKFSQDFPHDVTQSNNVTIYENATVVELICRDDDIQAVESALVRTFDGKEFYFKAKHFIITANALQTPRLLLNSTRHHPNGIGNQHDNVGRYYFDHNLVPSGYFRPHDRKLINQMGFYDMQAIKGASVLGKIVLSPEVMRAEGLRNFAAMLFPLPLREADFKAMSSLQAFKNYVKAPFNSDQKDIGRHIINIIGGWKGLLRALYEKVRYGVPVMMGLARGGWSKIRNNEKKYDRLELMAITEQTPNRANRVTLMDEKDALGCPKTLVHYAYSAEDLSSVKRAQAIIGDAISETGLGAYEPPATDVEGIRETSGIHHMMGTTRMSSDPQHGVVDSDCRVHDFKNIFIAGGAVFSTGSYANPTLTNLAVSLRVADKVKSLLKAKAI